MNDDELLAGIDLHTWRVPPPRPLDRAALVTSALRPATQRPKRPRMAWLFAALVVVNAAAIAIIVLTRPAPERVVVQAPAGGPVDAQVRDLLQRLEQEQRELEQRLAEIKELRALVTELSEKVRQYEREKTVVKPRDRQPPPAATNSADVQPVDPYSSALPAPGPSDACDEVSCVLSNYSGTCCAKYRKPPPAPPKPNLPETLDRTSISRGIDGVKARVKACANQDSTPGRVKVRVRVGPDGRVTSVMIDETPTVILGRCVATAVQRAVFDETQSGGSFSYPFVF